MLAAPALDHGADQRQHEGDGRPVAHFALDEHRGGGYDEIPTYGIVAVVKHLFSFPNFELVDVSRSEILLSP